MSLRALLLAGALPLLAIRAAAQVKPAEAAAEAEEDDDSAGGHSLEVGLRASGGREANTRDFDWGPTLSYELLTTRKDRGSRFKYELELSYNDALTSSRSADTSQSTRVRKLEFRYAKISILELFGFDFHKRVGVVPYLASGVQYVNSRQDSATLEGSESQRDDYWSPSFGCGAEVALNKKLTLALDYDRNIANGDRRVERLTLELKLAVFGGE